MLDKEFVAMKVNMCLQKKKAIRKENGIVSSKFMPRDTVEVAAVAMNHE